MKMNRRKASRLDFYAFQPSDNSIVLYRRMTGMFQMSVFDETSKKTKNKKMKHEFTIDEVTFVCVE
jgi:hypothetical protein